MKRPGQIVVLQFPQTDLSRGKRRPALLIAPLPGNYGDWLACMISTKLHQAITDKGAIIQVGRFKDTYYVVGQSADKTG